ncbi:hypothetical protein IDH44_23905 [Paenibacillus sp. IB182496]|uniref:Uncharacterized protein n=1 Tax=Paenibacillus sabuli TaxID=2772509 RepID=A0A927GUD7_9BACL|nr:hypothetical protein [Paenibacillus sabuli]MBD2848251.1 hypothetical protein [Paenibacillus sabuli]
MNQASPREVRVEHERTAPQTLTAAAIAETAGAWFAIGERVPGTSGRAVDFHRWYAAWREREGLREEPIPQALKLEAADAFEAIVPWEQLQHAAILVATEQGEPLGDIGPVRLYAPHGVSECLNVKRVVRLQFMERAPSDLEATYGFKKVFAPGEMRKK